MFGDWENYNNSSTNLCNTDISYKNKYFFKVKILNCLYIVLDFVYEK
jgi:hypothetical protein